jgi:hypothetical protein
MKSLKSIFYSAVVLLFLSWIAVSCKKNDVPSTTTGNNDPVKTDIGTPTGDETTTASIGAQGGTISSSDGILTVTIPAGALSASTTISIQPITNTAPLGIGDSYRLMPEGTTFAKPITLTFNYTQDMLGDSTTAPFLWIVTQAADGSWNAMLKSEVDTINKTVTIQSTHFSVWSDAMFMQMKLTPYYTNLKKGESVQLQMSYFKDAGKKDEELAPLVPVTDDGLEPLNPIHPLTQDIVSFKVKQWALNGVTAPVSNANGTLSVTGNTATFKAPDSKPKRNPQAISALVEIADKKGQKWSASFVSNIWCSGYDYLNLYIDGKSFEYNQYYDPLNMNGYSNILSTYSKKHFSILAANYVTNGSGLNNTFYLSVNKTSQGKRNLIDGEDITFTFTGPAIDYSFNYVTNIQTSSGCNAKQLNGVARLSINHIDKIVKDPKSTDLGNYNISGSISGTLYDSHPAECIASKPHTFSAEFAFEAK